MANNLPRPWRERLLDGVATLVTWISGLCMIVLILTFSWLVFGRYVLNATPTWVEQLSLVIVVTITFLSAAVGVRENTHLKVDLLPALLGPRAGRWLRLLCDLLLVGFGSMMAFYAWGLVQFSWRRSIPLLDIPEGVRYLPVVLGGVLIALFALSSLVNQCLILRQSSSTSLEES